MLEEDMRGRLPSPVGTMRPVLKAVLVLRLAAAKCCEIVEDRLRPLEPLTVAVREKRDLVLPLALLLLGRHLSRDEVDAELRQPLTHGRRVRAPFGLVEGEHEPMFDTSPVP